MLITLDSINKDEALRYMGQGSSRGEQPQGLQRIMEMCEEQLLNSIRPAYTYRVFDIAFTAEGTALKGTNLVLIGADIKAHLHGCTQVVLMCATLGIGADRVIKRLSALDIAHGFASDALGSAAIEQVCDIAEGEIHAALGSKYYTWRFSPGYGDLPLEQQREVLAVTDAQKRINLTLSEGGMMIPSKSVTAVIGVSEHEEGDREQVKCASKCDRCGMKNSCPYRHDTDPRSSC